MERLKEAFGHLHELAQKEGPLLERVLWQKILEEKSSRPLLEKPNSKITLLGKNTVDLAWQIWRSCYFLGEIATPLVILVGEKEISRSEMPPDETRFNIRSESIFSLNPEEFPKQDLVIAQNIIHQVYAPSLIRETKEILHEKGLIFATAPGKAKSVCAQLKLAGIHFRKKTLRAETLGFGVRETLFIFSKEKAVPISIPQKPRKRPRVISLA